MSDHEASVSGPLSRRQVRAVALDVGRARIGVAYHDEQVHMAVPHLVLDRRGTRRDVAQLRAVADQLHGELWVVGLPPSHHDPKQCSARLARNFAVALAETDDRPVVMVDEAETSREAVAELRSLGVRSRKLKGVIDKHAAARILDRWLTGQEAVEIG